MQQASTAPLTTSLIIKFLNSVIDDKRVIDIDESMLTAACRNIGGGNSSNIMKRRDTTIN